MLHLHGHFNDPASIVFGVETYARHKFHAAVASLQNAMLTQGSLVFIGCGGTLDDLNIGQALDEQKVTFKGAGTIRHYDLCRNREASSNAAADLLWRVGYGDDYSDLPDFLDRRT